MEWLSYSVYAFNDCGGEACVGSNAVNSLRVALPSEARHLTTKLATSSRLITPDTVVSSVNTASPVAGSDFKPPGRIIVQSYKWSNFLEKHGDREGGKSFFILHRTYQISV